MFWSSANSTNLNRMECTDTQRGVYLLRLSANPKIDNSEEGLDDLRCIPVRCTSLPTVPMVKELLLEYQKEFDKSEEVNSFIYNNRKYWFDKATRVGLINSIEIEQKLNNQTINIWFGKKKVLVDCQVMLNFLYQLEHYAQQCNNVTQQHLVEINQETSLQNLLDFNITAGYPEKIEFKYGETETNS